MPLADFGLKALGCRVRSRDFEQQGSAATKQTHGAVRVMVMVAGQTPATLASSLRLRLHCSSRRSVIVEFAQAMASDPTP